MTAAERKRKERDARRAAGYVRLELWLHPDDHEAVKRYAERIAKSRAKIEGLVGKGKTP